MILTFDIGGTFLRAGIYDEEADRIVARDKCLAPSFKQFPGLDQNLLREKLYAEMRSLSNNLEFTRPRKIGVAFPGPVDRGMAMKAPTLWGDGFVAEPLSLKIKKVWPEARVGVFNDLTAAGYSFLRKPDDDLCVVTVSSGIGQKVFVGGRPLLGPRSRGGEIGHWRVEWGENPPRCDCGGVGHLGAVASGRATPWQIQRLVSADPAVYEASVHGRKDPNHLTNQEIAQAFCGGDLWTRKLINTMAKPLGRALAAIHLTVGTERFAIMGGFANALGSDYLEMLKSAAEEAAWEPCQERAWRFELAEFGDDAGLLGSGRLVSREIEIQ